MLDGFQICFRTADQCIEAADLFAPFQAIERIFDAEHRRRVDGFALENAFDELAAFSHLENFGQRPGRGVRFEPCDGARARARSCRALLRRP